MKYDHWNILEIKNRDVFILITDVCQVPQIVLYYEAVYDENSRSLQTTHFYKQGTSGNIKFSVSNENNLMGLCLFIIKINVKKKEANSTQRS